MIWNKCGQKAYIILPAITLFCLAGFIGSYIFPNKVLDTYVINGQETEDEEEFPLSLEGDQTVSYEWNAGEEPMKGIQVGISKNGGQYTTGTLVYEVSDLSGTLISSNTYALSQGFDLQYVYLPFAEWKSCKGKLRITFRYDRAGDSETLTPALMADHTVVKDTVTCYQGTPYEGSLKSSYIYTHNTYPFLYDFRIMTFVFLAATMTIPFSKGRKKGEKTDEE